MLATDAKPNRAIARFAARGESYLWFAAHAAVPLALTTELLYSLWAEFRQDGAGDALDVPWVVVADLLFSGLCEEVGHELYELRPGVRSRLLEQLQAEGRFGESRLVAVGRYVWAYGEARLGSEDPDLRDLAQVWAWSGQAFCEPEGAARSIMAALVRERGAESGDVVRLAQVVAGLQEPLAGFPEVGMYARLARAGEFGDEAAAQGLVRELGAYQREHPDCLVKVLPEVEEQSRVVDRRGRSRWWKIGGAIAGLLVMGAIAASGFLDFRQVKMARIPENSILSIIQNWQWEMSKDEEVYNSINSSISEEVYIHINSSIPERAHIHIDSSISVKLQDLIGISTVLEETNIIAFDTELSGPPLLDSSNYSVSGSQDILRDLTNSEDTDMVFFDTEIPELLRLNSSDYNISEPQITLRASTAFEDYNTKVFSADSPGSIRLNSSNFLKLELEDILTSSSSELN
ncbi:MAG: hypothetical protein AAGG51_14740 [Cyanobacteria bacterium P01_G01_bin.54]